MELCESGIMGIEHQTSLNNAPQFFRVAAEKERSEIVEGDNPIWVTNDSAFIKVLRLIALSAPGSDISESYQGFIVCITRNIPQTVTVVGFSILEVARLVERVRHRGLCHRKITHAIKNRLDNPE